MIPAPETSNPLDARTRLLLDLDRAAAATGEEAFAAYRDKLAARCRPPANGTHWYTADPERLSREQSRVAGLLEPEPGRMLMGLDDAGRMCAVGKLTVQPDLQLLVAMVFPAEYPHAAPRLFTFVDGTAALLTFGLDQEWEASRDAGFALARAAEYLRATLAPRLTGG